MPRQSKNYFDIRVNGDTVRYEWPRRPHEAEINSAFMKDALDSLKAFMCAQKRQRATPPTSGEEGNGDE